MDADLLDLLVGLVGVGQVRGLRDSQKEDTVVGHVGKELGELDLNLSFALFRNLFLGVGELSNDSAEEIVGVGKVLDVVFTLAADHYKLLKYFWAREHVEAVVVFAELHEDGVGVESLLEVVLVFGGERVEQAQHDLVAFLGEDVLHFLLLLGKHALVFSFFVVVFGVRTVRVVHGHAGAALDLFISIVLRFDLNLEQFNE